MNKIKNTELTLNPVFSYTKYFIVPPPSIKKKLQVFSFSIAIIKNLYSILKSFLYSKNSSYRPILVIRYFHSNSKRGPVFKF